MCGTKVHAKERSFKYACTTKKRSNYYQHELNDPHPTVYVKMVCVKMVDLTQTVGLGSIKFLLKV